jgi:hypothetical protein
MPRSADPQRVGTIALRIQFNGRDGQNVSRSSQDDIQSLFPWLKATMSSLRLPHPKLSNVIKRIDATNVIDMFWDGENIDVRAYVLYPPFRPGEHRPAHCDGYDQVV